MQFFSEKNIRIICTVAGIFVLCAALVVCGVYLATRDDTVNETTEETTVETTEEVTTVTEEETTVEEETTEAETEHKLTLSDLEIGDTSWAYFIVNRTNYVPAGYEENLELAPVWSNGQYYYFDARIADFAQCMINDAERDGVTLLVCSAYRTHASQTANFENQIKSYASAKYSFADAYTYTSRYIAIPGTSEHQTGLAVDFITPGYMYLDDGFEYTDAYKWLSENSYKYGFILRYPSEKAAETGINYEPWHFRFIGFENAEDIYNSGLCLEEYMSADENIQFNPMAPLQIPAEPYWYQSYINPPTPETQEADTTEAATEEIESDTEEEIPDWLLLESESTNEEAPTTEEVTANGEDIMSDTEEQTSETENDTSDEETLTEETIEEETTEENTTEDNTTEEVSDVFEEDEL